VDATRRTRLATERTELAWWRTGLTALAVALGVGRVVPELGHGGARWPYVVADVGFAIWGSSPSPTGTALLILFD
jgi:putative membrane protein